MFHPVLKRKFEYFTNYFESALNNTKRGFAQSLIFYGQDICAQYYLALELSRLLNCQKSGAWDCDCINCTWIRNNQHPAVLTISKNDNKPADDASTKVISVKQTLAVNNSLINSSDYYRVFIFCDSMLNDTSKLSQQNAIEFSELNFKYPQENWLPKPLNKEVLAEASANSMLKSIEEPPSKTLFIFLTEDKDDIIETIVSRSQCFYVPSFGHTDLNTDFLDSVLSEYPVIKKIDVLNLVEKLTEIINSCEYSSEYVLDCIELYLVQMFKNNVTNKTLTSKIKKDILDVQTAKKQCQAYIKPQLVFEDLFFKLSEKA